MNSIYFISPKTRQKYNKENRKSLIVKDFRFLLGDSVGIRTQDPQLRRLLLYPTELPNQATMFSDFSERGCKDRQILQTTNYLIAIFSNSPTLFFPYVHSAYTQGEAFMGNISVAGILHHFHKFIGSREFEY